jgi:CRP-like cAMP-binding protein
MNVLNIEFFEGISPESKAKFEKAMVTRPAKKGDIIFLQEDEAKFFYIIKSGWVKLFRETLDGEEAIVDIVTDGHIFGNHALFDESRYSYNAESLEQTALSQIPLSVLMECMNSDQKLAFNIIKLFTIRQKKQRREIEHLTIQTAPQRIGCFLLRLCKDRSAKNLKLHLPYDKSLIASRLGMKAETFSRALAKLREEVGIEIIGSTVVLSSVNSLAEYTCSACSDSFPCEDVKA